MRRHLPLLTLLAVVTLAWSGPESSPTSRPAADSSSSASPASRPAGGMSEAPPPRTAAARMGSNFKEETVGWGLRLRGVLGYGLILLIGFLLSKHRDRIRWRTDPDASCLAWEAVRPDWP